MQTFNYSKSNCFNCGPLEPLLICLCFRGMCQIVNVCKCYTENKCLYECACEWVNETSIYKNTI